MQIRDRVKLKSDGRLGTLCPTISMLLSDGVDELSVVFDDGSGPLTLNCFEEGRDAFEVIGTENAIPKPTSCGAGKAEACCIYLTVGNTGFNCERFGKLRYTLQFRTMNAKRDPTEPFPHCMNQGD